VIEAILRAALHQQALKKSPAWAGVNHAGRAHFQNALFFTQCLPPSLKPVAAVRNPAKFSRNRIKYKQEKGFGWRINRIIVDVDQGTVF